MDKNMADQDSKSEISKDVLAPPEEVRQDLVATAVKFLQNPKVTQSPLSQKKAFLQRKGLTLEEIELAIQRSGVATSTQQTVQDHDLDLAQLGPPPSVPSKKQDAAVSKWMKARDVLKVVTMVTGISYAAYKLYKEFLRPWLFGEPTVSRRLDQLEKMMTESVANISSSLTTIEQNLKTQQEKLQMLSHDVNSKTGAFESVSAVHNKQGIAEIKSDLTSIKGLLLNRRQFPAMPASSPVLPAWQLTSNAGDGNSNNKGKTEESDEAAEVSLTTISQAENQESRSLVTMETENSDTDAKETILLESEKQETAELQDTEKLSSPESHLKDELENEVREPEVKVTNEEEDSGSNASLD